MKIKFRWIVEVVLFLLFASAFAFFRDAYSGYFGAVSAVQQLNSSWDSLAPVVAYSWAYKIFGSLAALTFVLSAVFEVKSFMSTDKKENENEEA